MNYNMRSGRNTVMVLDFPLYESLVNPKKILIPWDICSWVERTIYKTTFLEKSDTLKAVDTVKFSDRMIHLAGTCRLSASSIIPSAPVFFLFPVLPFSISVFPRPVTNEMTNNSIKLIKIKINELRNYEIETKFLNSVCVLHSDSIYKLNKACRSCSCCGRTSELPGDERMKPNQAEGEWRKCFPVGSA